MRKLLGVVLLLGAVGLGVWFAVIRIQGTGPKEGATSVRFEELDIPFEHGGNLDVSLPFMAVSAIDIDGDGVDEVFLGNGQGHHDGLYRFEGSAFHRDEVASEGLGKAELDATMGAASIDANGDGLEDLFVARESGVYYLENLGNGDFSRQRLEFGMDEKTVPLSIALGDINRDGAVDLYVSGYIRLSDTEGETNFDDDYGGYSYLLLNSGDNSWTDISRTAGVFRQHNTFAAVFAELNNDGWVDLVVAQDTGVVETWRNETDGTFSRQDNPTISSYPMGIGAGDIDNDGLVDLFFSNVGRTLPEALLRGNLPEDTELNMNYMLLRNEGNFAFVDEALKRNAAEYGFGWGTTIADMNNDGRMDLYLAQNYARFPGASFFSLYPGRLLEQQLDGAFLSVEKSAGLTNKRFGISQIVSDFNGDARLDIVLANLTGPARAFLNRGEEGAGLLVQVPSEASWLNTRVVVTTLDGQRYPRQLIASTGLGSDSADALHIGLGAAKGIREVLVERPDGWTQRYAEVPLDSVLEVETEDLESEAVDQAPDEVLDDEGGPDPR